MRTHTRAAAVLLLAVLAQGDKSLKGGGKTDFWCWTGLLTERLAPMSQRNDECYVWVCFADIAWRGFLHAARLCGITWGGTVSQALRPEHSVACRSRTHTLVHPPPG